MKLILHIGTEKTGSSTIQYLLGKNEKALLDLGYFFVNSRDFGLNLEGAAEDSRLLAAYAMNLNLEDDIFKINLIDTPDKRINFRQRVKSSLGQLLENLPDKIHTIIASSEHFHSQLIHAEEITRVLELFSPYLNDVKIICYLRDQADTAVSLYSTALKGGETLALEDFLHSNCVAENHYFNYYRFIEKWENVFGKESICLRIFSKDCFVNNNLVDDFLGQIDAGLHNKLEKMVPVKNESINHFSQVLAKSINRYVPFFIQGVGVNADNTELKRLVTENAYGKGLGLSKGAYDKISSQFDQSNEMVRQKYFPERPTLFVRKQIHEENRMIGIEQEDMLDNIIKYLAKRHSTKNLRLNSMGLSRKGFFARAKARLSSSANADKESSTRSNWRKVQLLTKGIATIDSHGRIAMPIYVINESGKTIGFSISDARSSGFGWQIDATSGQTMSNLKGLVRTNASVNSGSLGIMAVSIQLNKNQQQQLAENGSYSIKFCIVNGSSWLSERYPLNSSWSILCLSQQQ